MQYTAREGGSMLKQAAIDHLDNYLENAEGEEGLARLFSLRHEFATEWHRFKNPVNGQPLLTLTHLNDRLPFFTRSKKVEGIDVTSVSLLVRGTVTGLQLNGTPLSPAAPIGDIAHYNLNGTMPALQDNWQFTATDTGELQDAWLVIQYSLQIS